MPYKNREDRNRYYRQWYKNNPGKRKEYNKEYYKNNRERLNECGKKWRENNREKVNEYSRKYYENYPERVKGYQKRWRDNNPNRKRTEKSKENHKIYMRYKRRTDPKYNLNHKISREIYKSLNGNKYFKKWETLVGYTLIDLIKYLKRTLPEGYTWQDFMQGKLHIDYIIPINAFNFTRPEHIDFKRCWALENLRLLPARENISKKDKLSKPFQPALKI